MTVRLTFPLILLLAAGSACADSPFASYNGEQLYGRFCASCHGKSGFGDGPVAASFKVLVPDLTRIAQRQGGRFPADRIRRVVDGRDVVGSHGSRLMPVWGEEFQGSGDADVIVGRLVEYLRSIQR